MSFLTYEKENNKFLNVLRNQRDFQDLIISISREKTSAILVPQNVSIEDVVISMDFAQTHVVYFNPANQFQFVTINGVRGVISQAVDDLRVIAGPPNDEERIRFLQDSLSVFTRIREGVPTVFDQVASGEIALDKVPQIHVMRQSGIQLCGASLPFYVISEPIKLEGAEWLKENRKSNASRSPINSPHPLSLTNSTPVSRIVSAHAQGSTATIGNGSSSPYSTTPSTASSVQSTSSRPVSIAGSQASVDSASCFGTSAALKKQLLADSPTSDKPLFPSEEINSPGTLDALDSSEIEYRIPHSVDSLSLFSTSSSMDDVSMAMAIEPSANGSVASSSVASNYTGSGSRSSSVCAATVLRPRGLQTGECLTKIREAEQLNSAIHTFSEQVAGELKQRPNASIEFLELQAQNIRDFMVRLDGMFREHPAFQPYYMDVHDISGASHTDVDIIRDCVERILMKRLHDLFPEVHRKLDSFLFDRCEANAKILRPPHFDLDSSIVHDNSELIQRAIVELRRMSTFRTPRDRLVSIVNCCKILFSALSSESGADEFFPLLVYTVLLSRVPNWHSSLWYIENLRHPLRMTGEAEYYATCARSAVQHLTTLDAVEAIHKEKEEVAFATRLQPLADLMRIDHGKRLDTESQQFHLRLLHDNRDFDMYSVAELRQMFRDYVKLAAEYERISRWVCISTKPRSRLSLESAAPIPESPDIL
eukprot:ANDGO_04023.mRNA.1 Vacuolar protein sorting-associated protein 9A